MKFNSIDLQHSAAFVDSLQSPSCKEESTSQISHRSNLYKATVGRKMSIEETNFIQICLLILVSQKFETSHF